MAAIMLKITHISFTSGQCQFGENGEKQLSLFILRILSDFKMGIIANICLNQALPDTDDLVLD